MANHKKAWADDDKVLENLSFPKVSQSNQARQLGDKDIINGKHEPPTGKYKYRCVDCGEYYDSERKHSCK